MKYIYRMIIGMAILFFLSNCQNSAFNQEAKNSFNLQHRNLYKTGYAYSDIKLVQQLIEKGQFAEALPKLLSIQENGDTDSTVYYYLGIVYQELGSPQNALENYVKYLQVTPNGIYAEHSRKKISELLGTPLEQAENIDTIDNHIRLLEQKLQQDPQNSEIMLQLANWYWINQEFTKAGDLYKRIVSINPDYWNNSTVASRIEKGSGGEIIVLTPEEALKREAEKNPIVFFNVTSFRSGRGLGWASDVKHHIYNVSGQVRNRSLRTLRNVSIQVTIYGLTGMVYDTQTIHIGNLSSGQARPFSVQFVNFDNIENIDHYDYTAYYDE